MKKSELNEKFLGMNWSSIAAGLVTFLIGNQIKNKVVKKAVMNNPKIKSKIKDITNRAMDIQKEMEDVIAKQKEMLKKY